MPQDTWFMTNTVLDSVHQEMSETSPGANALTSPVVGWNVGTEPIADCALMASATEVLRGVFAATLLPDGTAPLTTGAGDCLRTTGIYTRSYDSGDWVLTARVGAVTSSSSQAVRVRIRLWRSANADGSSATQITSAAQVGTSTTALVAGTPQNSVVTFNPGAFSLSNEYLFVQIACEVVAAGTMTGADADFFIGTTATRLVSANYSTVTPTSDDPKGSSGRRNIRVNSNYRTKQAECLRSAA